MNAVLVNRILTVLGFAGIFVAGYLTAGHWMGAELACMSGVEGCGKIASSSFAFVGPIPTAFFGLIAYAILTSLALVRAIKGDPSRSLAKLGLIVSGLGFFISAILMYVAFFVEHARCEWCITSAIIMTVTFVLHISLAQFDPVQPHYSPRFTLPVGLVALGALAYGAVSLAPKVGPLLGYTTNSLTPEMPHKFGVPGAPLVIIEFIDLSCAHCRSSYEELNRLLTIEQGNFEVIVRHFPLHKMEGHEMSLPAAALSEIVAEKGNKEFFQFVERVFATAREDLTVDAMLQYAKALGVDADEAAKRIVDKNDPAFKRMALDIAKADELAILQTPTFFIGPRGGKVYAAKSNSFVKVMFLPDIQPLWDTKLKKK